MSYITFPKPTEEQCRAATSEVQKYRFLIAPYCTGCGADIGTQGVNAVPWAVGVDLPCDAFVRYCGTNPAKGPIQLRAYADALPFDSKSLNFLVSCHQLEDAPLEDWPRYIGEWIRCVKPGGRVIVIVPDKKLWEQHLANGGIANANHKHEYEPGDFVWVASQLGVQPPDERYTDACPSDYSYMAVFWVQ
jgi:SAM-dependent methyltransferase